MDFDTKRFISEIQNRPSIWDTNCLEYSDKITKRREWEELVNVFNDAQLPTEEKKKLGLNLQKKWRNIRDCFVKAHKARKTKRGSASKKKYLFYNNLLFLKDTISVDTTASNINIDKKVFEDNQNDVTLASNSPWAPKRNKNNKNDDHIGELIRILNKNLEKNNVEDDEDRLFFLSLVKEFKKIPDPLKMQTKLDILKIIKDAQC